ncbi:MAG: class I mannose-6-phosphate isomerase [Bacteroidales bacterium]|nr:class I mannose-6-phosphate isomerase [Bacteroidales bacterium]
MNRLYPLLFKPIFKEKIWGGQRIKTVLGKDFSPLHNCGEAWLISGVEGENSVVSNGFLADNELNELIEVYMDNLVGGPVYEKFGETFPLLFKFIDSRDYLSIQVHPDDALAAERHGSFGKTEMWYVIDAERDAELITGFRKTIDRRQFIDHLQNRTLRDILNTEKVSAGDVFYLPAGRIHALGPGILLTEIQQTSDITYRTYDWDRTDPQGKSRELHILQALEAMDYEAGDPYRTDYVKRPNETVPLVESPYFTTNLLQLTRPVNKDFTELDSFVVYICTGGSGELVYRDGNLRLASGDAVLIPAELPDYRLNPAQSMELLEVYLEE